MRTQIQWSDFAVCAVAIKMILLLTAGCEPDGPVSIDITPARQYECGEGYSVVDGEAELLELLGRINGCEVDCCVYSQ
jgi:hypothetical protein